MALIGAALVGSAMTDGVLAWDFLANGGRVGGAVVAFVQSLFVLVMGLAARFGVASAPEEEATAAMQDNFDHADVLAQLETLFATGLHRREDLSLRRIARRLGLPDRRVSEAVNRLCGKNLSQYVNDYRVREACDLLRQTEDNILQIALAVGFTSKSNFNREFLRVTGQTPSIWRSLPQTAILPRRGAV